VLLYAYVFKMGRAARADVREITINLPSLRKIGEFVLWSGTRVRGILLVNLRCYDVRDLAGRYEIPL